MEEFSGFLNKKIWTHFLLLAEKKVVALQYCGVKPLNLLMGIQAAKINVIIDFLNILWYNITRNEVI